MKSVELKLLVEGVGEDTFEGEVEDTWGVVNWKNYKGNLGIKSILSWEDKTMFDMQERALRVAEELYPNRNISAIMNYGETK